MFERTIVPGADFLQLDPSSVPRGGRTAWLTDALRAAIGDGRLAVGDRLPASRLLAGELGVARGVVVEAYQRLVDEGLLRAEGARGTVVATAPMPAVTAAEPAPTPWRGFDLAPGVPDLSAFPRSAWLRAERDVLADADAGELGYGDPRGAPALRSALSAWLGRSRGVRAAPEDIVVVAGVVQALALLAWVLTQRGERAIAVEDPGSRGTRDQFEHWGVEPVPVPVDDDGLDVAALQNTGLRTVLMTPAHHFPTGVVLAPHRRRALLDWGGLVVEDDYDAEHRYDRAPVPALQRLAPDRVLYASSVSKTLAPGMRLGWMVPPPDLRDDLVAHKRVTDLGNAALPQLVLARLITSGELERHLRRVRARQRVRRDAMLDALRTHLPGAEVHGVAAGLHMVVTFPPGLDDRDLAERARDAGVLVQPLSMHRVRPGPPGLVLGYAAHSPDRIREAIARLGASLARATPKWIPDSEPE